MSKKILAFDGIVSRSVVIEGKPLDEVLSNRETADCVLDSLGLGVSPDEALRRLENPYEGETAPEQLMGVEGIAVVPFLKGYVGRFVDNMPNFRVKVGGKACDHIFIPDPADPLECPDKGLGHLSVDVLQEYFNDDEDLRACKPNKTEFYHWDIKILHYDVHERYDLKASPDHSNFPGNPFPDLRDIEFPDAATNPGDPRSIWCRCLTHKLYAKGLNVQVERVYRQICSNPSDPGDEDFRLLDKAASKYAAYYTSTLDSCVDIMFAGYPPLAGLPKQREYCLGRCKHPDIVNTGA